MLIRRLVFENFGLCGGSVEFDLEPRVRYRRRRPIRDPRREERGWQDGPSLRPSGSALYGQNALGSRVRRSDYEEYLRSRVHRARGESIQPKRAMVGLDFDVVKNAIVERYTVQRSWELQATGAPSEALSVLRDRRQLDGLELLRCCHSGAVQDREHAAGLCDLRQRRTCLTGVCNAWRERDEDQLSSHQNHLCTPRGICLHCTTLRQLLSMLDVGDVVAHPLYKSSRHGSATPIQALSRQLKSSLPILPAELTASLSGGFRFNPGSGQSASGELELEPGVTIRLAEGDDSLLADAGISRGNVAFQRIKNCCSCSVTTRHLNRAIA